MGDYPLNMDRRPEVEGHFDAAALQLISSLQTRILILGLVPFKNDLTAAKHGANI